MSDGDRTGYFFQHTRQRSAEQEDHVSNCASVAAHLACPLACLFGCLALLPLSLACPLALPAPLSPLPDLTKGTQDKDFSYSFFDSLSFAYNPHLMWCDVWVWASALQPHTHTITHSHTHTHSLSLVLVVMMKSKELKTKISHARSLILSPLPTLLPCSLSLASTSHAHSHTLTITCTCCYDEIKGIQDLKIYSLADSLHDSLACLLLLAIKQHINYCRCSVSTDCMLADGSL